MKRFYFSLLLMNLFQLELHAQSPAVHSSADILQDIKKLSVFGSVLYVAAHPDDENTRLLAYLANERRFRTGYLSLTRGDGGQNLIGNEQGIDLGLIRTQELLSARRIDGAEQFFSRAYDFGYSKNPEEALRIWGHNKILSDVVWVIRKFRPDVIITRFPTTGEGGHGHHTASAILAGEAFDAAADATKFPEQLKYVSVWQAKRLLWNTFNFGNTNTTREDQFKIDAGVYNPILGKSYGEIAAESRSRHKSQGFGVPAQRGKSIEYFSTIKGEKPLNDLMDEIDISAARSGMNTSGSFETIRKNFSFEQPSSNLNDLIAAYKAVEKMPDVFWRNIKLAELKGLVEKCSGIFLEAVAANQLNITGDSMKIRVTAINRTGADIKALNVKIGDSFYVMGKEKNINNSFTTSYFIPADFKGFQPYWLVNPLQGGSFDVKDQQQIGMPENEKKSIDFNVTINDQKFIFTKPILYKYTDPVKGELYEPVDILPPVSVSITPALIIIPPDKTRTEPVEIIVQANADINRQVKIFAAVNGRKVLVADTLLKMKRNEKKTFTAKFSPNDIAVNTTVIAKAEVSLATGLQQSALRTIKYDHIPDIFYEYADSTKISAMDIKTIGSRAGYIAGAGDKIPDALMQMGYSVTMLQEKDITAKNLQQFDVIITGVRAYNIHSWLTGAYPVLMNYVKEGGVLFVQYNTNNSLGPVKAVVSPYPFTISGNRVTDENAAVNFLLPDDPVLNYPNKITEKDFAGWIQERSIYNAENIDPAFRKIFSMKDPGENEQTGSLIVADYGKGKFIYTGLVFFRELPAGIPGAYRLFANLIAGHKAT